MGNVLGGGPAAAPGGGPRGYIVIKVHEICSS